MHHNACIFGLKIKAFLANSETVKEQNIHIVTQVSNLLLGYSILIAHYYLLVSLEKIPSKIVHGKNNILKHLSLFVCLLLSVNSYFDCVIILCIYIKLFCTYLYF